MGAPPAGRNADAYLSAEAGACQAGSRDACEVWAARKTVDSRNGWAYISTQGRFDEARTRPPYSSSSSSLGRTSSQHWRVIRFHRRLPGNTLSSFNRHEAGTIQFRPRAPSAVEPRVALSARI